jgi:heme exporter protein B
VSLTRDAWLIARKDLRVEWRSRELIYTTVFFAMTCVLVFAFVFVRDGKPIPQAPAGILWVTMIFSGTLALGRTFERERQAETLRALLLSPVERQAVYLGKLCGVLGLLAAVQVALVPILGLMFQAPIGRSPMLLAGLLGFGMVGFAAVGTLFAAMLVRAQSRDVLLPIVLYPLVVPLLIAGVQGTAALFAEEPNLDLARFWLSMLVSFDAVFVTLAFWTFGAVMTE